MLLRHVSAEEPWVLEWIRRPSDTCGRANSIWIRYVWTGKFFNPERKSCGFKNIWIRVDGAWEIALWWPKRTLLLCSCFSVAMSDHPLAFRFSLHFCLNGLCQDSEGVGVKLINTEQIQWLVFRCSVGSEFYLTVRALFVLWDEESTACIVSFVWTVMKPD